MLISSHIAIGIGKGWRRPYGERAWYLLCWQSRQDATNSAIVFFMPIQYNDCAKIKTKLLFKITKKLFQKGNLGLLVPKFKLMVWVALHNNECQA